MHLLNDSHWQKNKKHEKSTKYTKTFCLCDLCLSQIIFTPRDVEDTETKKNQKETQMTFKDKPLLSL